MISLAGISPVLPDNPDEIRGAYLLMKTPASPRLNKMVRLIAQLGGFLARKSDGEAGAETIWLGLQCVMDAAMTLQALREGY
jgi:Transposase Tn5 dimerisation domain